MDLARVDDTNVVVNIEVADDDWLERPESRQAGFRFVPYTDDNPAHIGLTYDPDTGLFEQPPSEILDQSLPEAEDG